MKKLISLMFLLVSAAVNANEVHLSTTDNIFRIPFAVLDGEFYYENIQILMNQDTGTFVVLSADPAEMPEGPYRAELKWDSFTQLITGNEARYVNLISESRCAIGLSCLVPGEVQINMFVRDDNGQLENVSLTLSGDGIPDANGELVGDFYIRLLEVNPYPIFGTGSPFLTDTSIVIEYSLEPF